ncbi:hypothetical protein KC957_04280, partial [Candidatus Saccharibacteria bacterium]|nr:hypothetical protein [Candidatus Saccharibacteria bacterium]
AHGACPILPHLRPLLSQGHCALSIANYQTLILRQPVRVGTGSIEKCAREHDTSAFLIEVQLANVQELDTGSNAAMI